MSYYHGVRARQVTTSVSTPVTATSGVTFAVGTAPVHTATGAVNKAVYGGNYAETVGALGYGDDWKKYSLCEVMYSHFKLYKTAPVIFVNVLDPAKHRKEVDEEPYPVINRRVTLPLEAIIDTVIVETYAAEADYELFYDNNAVILEICKDGSIPPETTELTVSFTEVDPSQVTKADIIGGFNVNTKQTGGLALIDSVFPRFGVIADIVIAPGWSHDAEVAAVMSAVISNMNGVFEGKAFIDVDTGEAKHYTDAPAWKKSQNMNSKAQYLFYLKGKQGEREFHMSTQAAALVATVDEKNGGAPSDSPSNKLMQINSTVTADGAEVFLDLQQANLLNANGIATALNLSGGFVLWGDETACFPANTDVKDYFISISRMFGWVSNSVIITNWSKVDSKLNRRLTDSVVDSLNKWLNGLTSEGHLLGGRVDLLPEENSDLDIAGGKAVFHIFLTPPSTAREIEFVLEYDLSYLTAVLAA